MRGWTDPSFAASVAQPAQDAIRHDGCGVCDDVARARPQPCRSSVAAILSLIACLSLSMGLFLFEIYSPDYGFRMPWLQTMLDGGRSLT